MSGPALVLVCVFSLLGRGADRLPPLHVISAPPPGVSANAQAFVSRVDGSIYLIASSPAFRETLASQARGHSRCGSRRALAMLASVVVHEEWHLKFGPDERGAYRAQLLELARHGLAESTESHGVKRSMEAVLARQVARAPSPTVFVGDGASTHDETPVAAVLPRPSDP